MAILRQAYSCDYKCGRKVVLSKKSMEDHETRCFHNPEKKACASCKYFSVQSDDNGMIGTRDAHSWSWLDCSVQDIELDKMTSNCEFHEPK